MRRIAKKAITSCHTPKCLDIQSNHSCQSNDHAEEALHFAWDELHFLVKDYLQLPALISKEVEI
jgi:hypothetical protein